MNNNNYLVKDVENYQTKSKLCIEANDGVIKKAETLLSNTQSQSPQAVQTQSSTASVIQWEQFCKQSNLEPTYYDKEANNLEDSKCCQNLRAYSNVSFRGAAWMYISPFISSSWWSSLESRKMKEKGWR